ncbi:MAG: UvrD-helicase domain-containing protein [Oscillospiraceae bacterium]|nr:UvrD-helicase domain-containing protein [Oscillospiraceae bacterium]
MNWTPQQHEAITADGRSLLVSAAAGSGKTAVLVERLTRLLSDPVHRLPADRMIVVTFTKDAAAQMKQRLADRIAAQLDALSDGSDPDAYDWLLEQRSALGSAHISTIHSFCFDLIREHADLLGVSPQFTIAEPSQESVYQERAMQSVLDIWGRERRADMELLASYFCLQNDRELEGMIARLAEFTKSLDFHRLWYRRVREVLDREDALPERLREGFLTQVQALLHFAAMAKPHAAAVIPDPANNPFLDLLHEDLAAMEGACDAIREMQAQELPLRWQTAALHFSAFPRVRKGVDADRKADFKQFRDYYKKWYDTLVESWLRPLAYAVTDLSVQRRTVPLLLELTESYLEALFAEKCRQDVLCFSDAEELTLELLCEIDEAGVLHRTELACTLSERYQLLMVDEYQDTNNKQDTIFKLLSRGGRIADGVPVYGTNAFLVGDVKQSIYSFRQANPENFRLAVEHSRHLSECTGEEMACLYLNQNFRSSRDVIGFVNALFRLLMTPSCGGLAYQESEELHFGALAYREAPPMPTTVIAAVPEEGTQEDVQALCVAERIDRMLREGAPVHLPDGTVRPCEPSDFCVLVRSVRKSGGAVEQALRERQIAVSCESSAHLLSLPEIRLLWNLLKIIDNPMTDTAMAAVLVSPLCGATAEELARLRLVARDRRLYLEMQRLIRREDHAPEDARLYKKCAEFLELLARLRSLAETLPLEECLREICDLTDLFSLQSLYEDAAQRREHLELFIRQAEGYRSHADLTASGCLSGWLRYLERLQESGRDPEIPSLGGDPPGSVVLKTIHKSKGLEYPFVFLVHLESRFHTDNQPPAVIPDPSGIVGLRTLDRDTLQSARDTAYTYVTARMQAQQKSEELRLLYVALTRARQQLFLVMNAGTLDPEKLSERALFFAQEPGMAGVLASRAMRMQDWIVDFLLAADSTHFLHMLTQEDCTSPLCRYEQWTPAVQEEAQAQAAAAAPALPDEAALAAMHRQLAFRYSSPQTELVSKYSVTALSHPQAQAEQQMRTPEFLKEDSRGHEKKLRGAGRGSAIHKLMQFLDPAAARADVKAACGQLLTQGFLSRQELEALPEEELQAFLQSELCSRIIASPEVRRESQFFVRIADLALPEDSQIAQSYTDTDGILIGTMDLIFREGDHWVLVDYKSDHVRTADELLERYDLQLGLYRKAAELLLGEPVTQGYLYSFTLRQAIPVPLERIRYDYDKLAQITEVER